jgi:hypothetical protein
VDVMSARMHESGVYGAEFIAGILGNRQSVHIGPVAETACRGSAFYVNENTGAPYPDLEPFLRKRPDLVQEKLLCLKLGKARLGDLM